MHESCPKTPKDRFLVEPGNCCDARVQPERPPEVLEQLQQLENSVQRIVSKAEALPEKLSLVSRIMPVPCAEDIDCYMVPLAKQLRDLKRRLDAADEIVQSVMNGLEI